MRVKERNSDRDKPIIQPMKKVDTAPIAEETDMDFGDMTFADSGSTDSSTSNGVSKVADDATEVEDIDIGDISSSDEVYRIKEASKIIDSKVLSTVDSSMSEIKTSMNDVILKQAEVLEKNAESMQCMQENITTVVKSQSELVSSISKAIDKKLTQNDDRIIGLVESRVDEVVYDTVAEPIKKQNKRRRRRRRNQRFWGILKFAALALTCIFLYTNDTTRERIGLVASDIRDIVVGIVNGEDVSSNKLVRDLGIKLHKINTVYYDEEGNEISEEEYYRQLYDSEKE